MSDLNRPNEESEEGGKSEPGPSNIAQGSTDSNIPQTDAQLSSKSSNENINTFGGDKELNGSFDDSSINIMEDDDEDLNDLEADITEEHEDDDSVSLDEPLTLDNSPNSNREPVPAPAHMEPEPADTTMARQPIIPSTIEGELINISSDDDDDLPAPQPSSHAFASQLAQRPPRRTARKSMKYNPIREQLLRLPQLEISAIGENKANKRHSDIPPQEAPQSKKQKFEQQTLIPGHNFSSFGGLDKFKQTIIFWAMHVRSAPSLLNYKLGVHPPKFLLHGPSGCGKTLLVHAVAGGLGIPVIRIRSAELLSGAATGESGNTIRRSFSNAFAYSPCIIFIDDIDAICPKRDPSRQESGMETMLNELIYCIDELTYVDHSVNILVIAATSRLHLIDPVLRKSGRFDTEVCIGMPDLATRLEILKIISRDMRIKEPVPDLEWLASVTCGFTGADLNRLLARAATIGFNRNLVKPCNSRYMSYGSHANPVASPASPSADKCDASAETEPPYPNIDTSYIPGNCLEDFLLYVIKYSPTSEHNIEIPDVIVERGDLQNALNEVEPLSKAEGFCTTTPNVTWSDIGSLKKIRRELEKSIVNPAKFSKKSAKFGVSPPSGILLCGPPGCGKTLLAKAVANESKINFVSVKGPELFNMYAGGCERAVKQLFEHARSSQPCLVFIDEIDALVPKRTTYSEGPNVMSRVLYQILTEMDRGGVYLMAAANRPDLLDPVVLRPGRLEKLLYVGLPSSSDRKDILRVLTKDGTTPPMKGVDLDSIASSSFLEGYSGADLAVLMKESLLRAFEEAIDLEYEDAVDLDREDKLFLTPDLIYKVATEIRPSVSREERELYEKLRRSYGLPSSSGY